MLARCYKYKKAFQKLHHSKKYRERDRRITYMKLKQSITAFNTAMVTHLPCSPSSKLWLYLQGCIHIDTSTSTGTLVWVTKNTSLHVFQWQPLTLIRVLYEYNLQSYKLFLHGSCFQATHTSNHTVLLINTTNRKDTMQFWCQQLHTILPTIVE